MLTLWNLLTHLLQKSSIKSYVFHYILQDIYYTVYTSFKHNKWISAKTVHTVTPALWRANITFTAVDSAGSQLQLILTNILTNNSKHSQEKITFLES